MTLVIIFWTTLTLCCIYVARVGELDEKICIGSYTIASLVSALVISPLPERMRSMEWRMFSVDLILLLVFLFFVVRSKRYWPLWTTGLQVVSLVGYTSILSPVRPRTDAMTLGMIAYAILGTLVVGAHRSRRRRPSLLGTMGRSRADC